jgi:hypothetical protein
VQLQIRRVGVIAGAGAEELSVANSDEGDPPLIRRERLGRITHAVGALTSFAAKPQAGDDDRYGSICFITSELTRCAGVMFVSSDSDGMKDTEKT